MDHHEKLFVLSIDAETNTVWIGDEKYLYKNQVEVVDTHLIDEIEDGETVSVKIRYAHKGSQAKVFKNQSGSLRLEFSEPQRAVTPGQAAVMYRQGQLLGGGWITC
jgi:tRNA-specific 2-thiouridylase